MPTPPRRAKPKPKPPPSKPKPPPPRAAEPDGVLLTRATAAVADSSGGWSPERFAGAVQAKVSPPGARPCPSREPLPPQLDEESAAWARASIGSDFNGALEDAHDASDSLARASAAVVDTSVFDASGEWSPQRCAGGVRAELRTPHARPHPPRKPPPPQIDTKPEQWGSQCTARERASSASGTGSDFDKLPQGDAHQASVRLTRATAAVADAAVVDTPSEWSPRRSAGGVHAELQQTYTEPGAWDSPQGERERASSLDSAGSGSDELLSTDQFAQQVSLDAGELARTITLVGKSARTEASSAGAALIDGEELSGNEAEVESEPEPQLESEPEPYVSVGPHFDVARLQAAAHARANPVWERSPQNGGPKGCGWCDQTFCTTRLRYHCHRCGWAVCDRCSPHQMILDTWLAHAKPHKVRHDVSDTALRVCDGCARAAHDPAAAPVFYLATIQRFSDHTSVRQVGPFKSDALAEWDAASAFDMHALFEMLPGATAATVLNRSLLMRDETALVLQRKVEASFAANTGRVKAEN